MLTKGTPSIARSIAVAVVVKDENIFVLTRPDGQIPLQRDHGFGVYYHDCRYVNGYELWLGTAYPEVLTSTAENGFEAVVQLTNPDIHTEAGAIIHKETIGIKWERVIEAGKEAFHDIMTFRNFGRQTAEFPASLSFNAEFEDVFVVRGLLPERLGTFHRPKWRNGCLFFLYQGTDEIYRSVSTHFSPSPHRVHGTTASFHFTLEPEQRAHIVVSLTVGESKRLDDVRPHDGEQPDLNSIQRVLRRASEEWMIRETEIVSSSSLLLIHVIRRSLLDLHVLRSTPDGKRFLAAGVPWFAALFGRDSLIASLQTLAYIPNLAEQTLRLLAQYQGGRVDDYRDEQPGEILHELRVGELAHSNEIPHTPYYGTIDATPLFLILLGCHARWTGTLAVFADLRSHVERALEWLSVYGDGHGERYLEYKSSSEKGLVNQGWKDSGDAIVNADGSLAQPPIAPVEVQGYVYMAKTMIADLYRRAGEPDRAEQLEREAQQLRTRFNRDFWLEEQGFYALAIQAGGRPCAVVSSNPGQALWTGIVDSDKAERIVERLIAPDMFSGWGIRTLSTRERRYSPIGYHLGTVWPHDNSLIAAGFRRYGFSEEALRIFTTIVEVAMYFEHDRLPEAFSGFSRKEYGVPVPYPVACHPQAWAAGSLPYLLETCLGLHPEAFEHRLRIVRPVLPAFIGSLNMHRLRVGGARVDLRFERRRDGEVDVDVLKVDGRLDVVVDSKPKD
ncbi:MAG: amylo-alpha-1,6-glucosidase [Nitrospiraceae bacterium]